MRRYFYFVTNNHRVETENGANERHIDQRSGSQGAIMSTNSSRTMIAALQVSLDGFIQGPNGEKDWADSWASAIALIPDVDTFVLGGRMYPDYGEYWKAIYANPERVPPFQERLPSKSEIAYARLAAQTPHIVLSSTLEGVSWPPTSQIVRDVAELRTLKSQPGKNAYIVGGATLVASLLNEDLIDELRLIVHPVVLGKGQGLFDGVNRRLSLDLVQVKSTESGSVIVSYRV
jgi:dihydrofolate reductase